MVLIIGGMAQGKYEFAKNNFPGMEIIDLNTAILDFPLEELLKKEAVFVSREVGNGIVPLSHEDREHRELIGSAQIAVAGKASEVYRVMAGIGQRIK